MIQIEQPKLSKPEAIKLIDSYYSRLQLAFNHFGGWGQANLETLAKAIRSDEKIHRSGREPRQCGLTITQAVKYFSVHYMMEQLANPRAIGLEECNHLNEGFKMAYGLSFDNKEAIAEEFSLEEAQAFLLSVDYAELMKVS